MQNSLSKVIQLVPTVPQKRSGPTARMAPQLTVSPVTSHTSSFFKVYEDSAVIAGSLIPNGLASVEIGAICDQIAPRHFRRLTQAKSVDATITKAAVDGSGTAAVERKYEYSPPLL